jgi:hypothetical protein
MMRRWTIIGALVLGSVAGAFAQTTGRIEGRVLDDHGSPMPGVALSLSGAGLQGERRLTSDEAGRFRFLALAPGDYLLSASLAGFNPIEASVTVAIDRTANLVIALTPAFEDAVVVKREAPTLDITSTTSGAGFSEQVFEALPVGRSFLGLSFAAPAVTDGGLGDNPSIRGASAAENRYIIDGLDVTDPVGGTSETTMPFEFLDQMEVKTGGYEAEYGGALGGIVNLVTRSGGNDLRADLFAYYTSDGLQASGRPTETFGEIQSTARYDLGVAIGGKIVTDELWYFAALNPRTQTTDQTNRQGIAFSTEHDRLVYSGKLTWQIEPEHQLVASLFGIPQDGSQDPVPNAAGRMAHDSDRSTRSFNVSYFGSLSPDLYVEANAGSFDDAEAIRPIDGRSPWYLDFTGEGKWARQQNCGDPDSITGGEVSFNTGCIGGLTVGRTDRRRDQLRAAAGWFVGGHELKVGLDLRRVEGEREAEYPASREDPLVDELGALVAPRSRGGFVLLPDLYLQLDVVESGSSETDELAFYIQDRWKLGERLSLSLGLRFDSFEAVGNSSSESPHRRLDFGFSDMIAPRLGLTWDALENGRSKVFASYSRFYESVPVGLNLTAFARRIFDLYFFLYPTDGSLPTYDHPGTLLFLSRSGIGTSVDSSIEPMYTDEAMLGFEYELSGSLVAGIRAVYREVGDVVEDISVDAGQTFFLTNPGGWYSTNPETGEPLAEPVFFPRASREYRALEVTLARPYRDDWQLFGSYVHSENEGNYVGLYRQDTGQLNPNTSSLFDLPELLEGADGPLPNDRPHQLKVYGAYTAPFGLTIGGFGWYLSGTPVSKLGVHTTYGPNERFITPRGSAGRTPDTWNLDLHFSYPIPWGSGREVLLVADVFNVANQQRAVTVDETWTFNPLVATEDPDECGGPGTGPGTACPTGNPFWRTALTLQEPRRVRFGVKLRW